MASGIIHNPVGTVRFINRSPMRSSGKNS
jgi:hypothetical protein